MNFSADPEKTRFDTHFAEDLAEMLNAAVAAVTVESLNPTGVLVWLAQRFRLEVNNEPKL